MDVADDSNFGIVDYCFFAAMLLISLTIGAVATFRAGSRSPEEFLMGNRTFGPFPVAFSLLTSFVSAISLLGFSGETYAYGMQIVWFIVGVILGIAAAAIIILPVIHPLKLLSINEYLELRFKSHALCKTVTVITTINTIVYMGIALYAPTLALETVTPLSSSTYILILGCVVTLYSSTGGIRAVVWTDVFQLTVMLLGLFIIIGVGVFEVGGPAKVWNTALEGGRLEIFDFTPSVYVRHTVWNTIIFGFLLCFSFFGVSQVNIQRLCTVPTMKEAQLVLLINIFGMAIIYILIFLSGAILYSAYATCDPWKLGLLTRKEEILPHYMIDRLYFIIGLPGVFVATIVGGALSSVSSSLNAVVAMIWKDLLSHLKIIKNLKPRAAAVINTTLSFAVGGVAIGIALLSRGAENLVQFSNTLLSATFGPILGTFILGLLFPKTDKFGVWAGIILSALLNAWISVGSFLYKPSPQTLPFSTDGCSFLASNETDVDMEITTTYYPTYDTSTSNALAQNATDIEDFPLMKLYKISYTLLGTIGTSVCIVTGIIASCLTGNQDIKDISPKYASPLVRRWYWDKEFLEEALSEEQIIYANGKATKSTEMDLAEGVNSSLLA